MQIGFTKMHGLGNDFVVIDNFNGRISLSKEQIISICDRHKGIGADGIILVETKEGSDCFMNYINADGTESQMCGNGIRCTAKFLKDYYLKDKKTFKIATRSGTKDILWEKGDIFSVNMGKASFESEDFEGENGNIEGLELDFVSVGNPFALAFVENANNHDLSSIGPLIENHKSFPNRINFEFVEEKGKNELLVRTWERGCGAVLACGTGACAAYAVFKKKKGTKGEVVTHLPGGDLFLSENKEGEIIMKGPAKSTFSGIVEL